VAVKEASAAQDRRFEDGARPAAWSALQLQRPFGWLEFFLALGGLALVAALALGPHIQQGGFYMDDWSNAAGALQPPGDFDFGAAVSYFADLTIYRPVLVLYVPLTYLAFGMNMGAHLAWAATLAVLAAASFYAVLRTLGVPWIHAFVIAALTIVFPWSDSTRLWPTAGQPTLSIFLVMTGLYLALLGLRRHGWGWHLAAAACYLLSILTYEVAIPLIACAGFLYWLQAGWREARFRWLTDVAIAVAGAIWVGAHTERTTSGIAGNVEHLGQIVTNGGTILGRTAVPVGSQQTTLVLCIVGLTIAAGAAAYFSNPRLPAWSGWGLRGWLILTGGGLALAALGWVMFIPADPYYTPSVFGMTNRVNALAAFGLLTAVYGTLGIVGSLVAAAVRPKGSVLLSTAVTVVLGAVLLASSTHVLRRHIAIWDIAYVAERTAIDKIRVQLPGPPPESTLFVGGYPANQTLGVPILAASWDLDGMMKMEYDEMSLRAYPILAGMKLVCRAQGVALVGTGSPEVTAPYGTARLLDLKKGRRAVPHGPHACQRVVDAFVPGPLYLSLTY
jgi:hypothetical protein